MSVVLKLIQIQVMDIKLRFWWLWINQCKRFIVTMAVNVIDYIFKLMSKTADMFAHTTIGNMIDITVVGIEENLYVK